VLHQPKRSLSSIQMIVSMILLIALIGGIQLGLRDLREGRESRQSVVQERFFAFDSYGQPYEISRPGYLDTAEYRQTKPQFSPPFTMTDDRRPTRFWVMSECEEE